MGIEYDLKKAYEDVISVFYDIAQDMTSSFDEKEIIAIALKLLKKVVDYESISFLKYNPKKDIYFVEETINYNADLKRLLSKYIAEGLIKWAANSGKPFVNVEEVKDVKTTVIVPLVYKEKMTGAMILHTQKDENYFEQNRLKILTIVSNQLAISFENINLYKNLEKRNEKMRALKNYMDNVITSMTNGIIVADNIGKIRVFNKKAEELLAVKAEEVNSQHISDTKLHYEFTKTLLALMIKTQSGNEIYDYEAEYKLNEEVILPLGISTTMLKKEDKDLGIIYVIRDLRESKELKELKRIDKLKDEFLSMVSHELRTPLTSIKAYVETLLYMVEDEEETDIESQKEFLNIISEESERLTRLINDVLDLSKIEAGKMTFIINPENIVDVIEKSIKNMRSFATIKNIEIFHETDEELPKVMIDKDRTLQVLANLINNAVKFTPEGGKITVWAEEFNERFIKVNIQDTGVGIKKEEQQRVFEKFKQSEDILTREAGGTGLGLPICKNIIEYYGGNLWVESEYRKGSTFMFTLPILEMTEGGVVNE